MSNDGTLTHMFIGSPPDDPCDSYWPPIPAEWHLLRLGMIQNRSIRVIRFSNKGMANTNKPLENIFFDGLLKNRFISKVHICDYDLDCWLVSQIKLHFSRNPGLDYLRISNCTIDCEELIGLLRTENTINSLSLNRLELGDDEMSAVIEAIADNPNKRIRKLDISQNIGVGNNTIFSCARLLSDPLCNILSIKLSESVLDDETARVLANAISNNKQTKLQYLKLVPDYDAHPCRITHVGWSAFSLALYDPSSLDATVNSNHTLTSLSYTRQRLIEAGAPSVLWSYLDWNHTGMGKKTKVVQMQFVDNFDVEKFKEYPLAVVPLILRWLACGCVSNVTFSGTYNILRKNTSVISWGRVISGGTPQLANGLLVRTASEQLS